LNDIPMIVGRKMDAVAFADMRIDHFDEMREESVRRPLVMGIGLHPYLMGQPYRLRHLRRVLKHIVASPSDIWVTTPGAIARHTVGLADGLVV
jgi:allantoinase